VAERVARYLVGELDMVERNPRGRYRWFTGAEGSNYFVGRNGAVRAGVTVSGSVSLTSVIHAKMKLWEMKKKEW